MKESAEKSMMIARVLKRAEYFALFAAVSIVSFAGFYYLTLATTFNSRLDVFIGMSGFEYAVLSLASSAAVSLLLGLYAALLTFSLIRRKRSCPKGACTATAGGGAIITAFVAGCPACGGLLLGLLGAPLALASLPLRGLELKAISIGLLAAAVFLLSKNLDKYAKNE